MKENKVRIRLMDVIDIDGVMEVEAESFTTPWTREAFHQEIKKNQFAYYFIAESGGKVIGYCGLWVIVGDAHITNIAVHPEARRMGVGEGLMEAAVKMARMLGADTLSLEVRVSNEPAQTLYRKFGFENGGIRKRYYTDNNEDALVMWVKLT
ncbi:ribosomal protein S18-alanine N-acetyltransferase [Alkalicoccus saliphilus]|jgi:[ribosomal protein S18]-alanine N-acetyltransferase|uniref:[Ribosomal protein bS18]-alanine N-acetyltransferase n=1 Tax=Alkalicoccus saliphilus TaxID=200989 RepID=A0A2T4U1Z1_9BACI|nr:ribosomal protein S18-alanine N-acetyltransferase [Alkalicoccus saliphilus]PTL37420.1 ribosomal-protein-alanine N-acetyltransferase [Alkalicoccus saliphilus]